MRISDWSSDVCSSDLFAINGRQRQGGHRSFVIVLRLKSIYSGLGLDQITLAGLQDSFMHLSLITQRTIVYQVQLRNGIVQPTLLLGNLNQQQARIGSVGDGATGLVIYRLSALSLHIDRKSTRLNSSH